jgi:hypothetical protein
MFTGRVRYCSCVDTFLGPMTTYLPMAFGFGVIALVGLAWPLLHHLPVRPQRPAAAQVQ